MNKRTPMTHRKLSIAGLIGLVLLGCLMAVVIVAKLATAPAPHVTPPNMEKTTSKTFTLPHSGVALPDGIPAPLFTSPDGLLVLVNKQTPIPADYAPTSLKLPTVAYRTDKSREEVMVRAELIEPLSKLFAAAKKDRIELMIGSAYRSAALQEMYFNSYVNSSGLAEAEKYSAHPGTSEHQTGLAVDLTTTDRACYLVTCFADTPAGRWLASHAPQYGFILRYPKGKESITQYEFEPWHFRYVGQPYAQAIYESKLAYEEAYPLLKAKNDGQ